MTMIALSISFVAGFFLGTLAYREYVKRTLKPILDKFDAIIKK